MSPPRAKQGLGDQTRPAVGDHDRLLTIRDVAKRLSVSERTVRNLANDKTLRGLRIGRVRRFDPRDVDAYIESSKRSIGRP